MISKVFLCKRCSSDDFDKGHGGQKATYLRHEVIFRCISGPVKSQTSYLIHILQLSLHLFRGVT